MSHRRLVYVIMNFPVGGHPYVEEIMKANPYLTSLYRSIAEDNSYLRKHDLERLGILFPAGPRYKMFAYHMPTDFMTTENEPTGRRYTDYMRERYLEEFGKKKDAADPPKLE